MVLSKMEPVIHLRWISQDFSAQLPVLVQLD